MVKCFNKGLFFIPCAQQFLDPIALKMRAPTEFFCFVLSLLLLFLMIAFKSSFPLVHFSLFAEVLVARFWITSVSLLIF